MIEPISPERIASRMAGVSVTIEGGVPSGTTWHICPIFSASDIAATSRSMAASRSAGGASATSAKRIVV
jgi:hypothetical protein